MTLKCSYKFVATMTQALTSGELREGPSVAPENIIELTDADFSDKAKVRALEELTDYWIAVFFLGQDYDSEKLTDIMESAIRLGSEVRSYYFAYMVGRQFIDRMTTAQNLKLEQMLQTMNGSEETMSAVRDLLIEIEEVRTHRRTFT